MLHSNTAAQFVARELAKGRTPNRLIHEKSPYLLQHAFNPVDWFPWGEDAFAEARAEDKPVFLSIGYSTCHWCHVMAKEAFENKDVAALLNEYFVCIKVDREERPDIDQLYMTVIRSMTGGGGWPMSVFLTTDLKPIYAGTYFPPEPHHGLPGFSDLLEKIHEAWVGRRNIILESAGAIADRLQKNMAGTRQEGEVSEELLDKAYQQIVATYDADFGGFGEAPKFPRPAAFHFLLRHYKRTGTKEALEIPFVTLRRMVAGGMYDHIGGGFHRYSVDRQWRVPHFEKMLYDQGQLVLRYLEAYQLTDDPVCANVARDVLNYVLRDLTGPEGAFYSAEDADSAEEGHPEQHGEGLFYLWKEGEITTILGKDNGAIFNYHYGVEKEGNALQDPQNEFRGKNILYIAHALEETAERFGKSTEEVAAVLDAARANLFEARKKRPRPHLDDKVITAWNGHMIGALARAFLVLREPRYLKAAEAAADFVMTRLYDRENGNLQRRYRDGEAGLAGQLDDYVFLVNGLLDLYEATFNIRWLKEAVLLTGRQIELFTDEKGGGFYDTPDNDPNIPVRLKSDYDGAEPAGNSMAALNLLRLAHMTGNEDWRLLGAATLNAFAESLEEFPAALPQMLAALDFQLAGPRQIVLAGKAGTAEIEAFHSIIGKRFLPNTIVMFADNGEAQQYLARFQPFFAEIHMLDNRATAYVCENFVCREPITEAEKLAALL